MPSSFLAYYSRAYQGSHKKSGSALFAMLISAFVSIGLPGGHRQLLSFTQILHRQPANDRRKNFCTNLPGVLPSNTSIRLGKSNSVIMIRRIWMLTKYSLPFRIRIGIEKNSHWSLLGAMDRRHETCPQPRSVRAQAPTHPAQIFCGLTTLIGQPKI